MKNCEEITMDMERARFQRLSARERMELRLHVAMCKNCRGYYRDSKKIHTLLAKHFSKLEEHTFSAKEKEEMKKRLAS